MLYTRADRTVRHRPLAARGHGGAGAAACVVALACLLAYRRDAGHGFLSDDFGWILSADAFLRHPSAAALANTTGFFRPLVTLSFAFDVQLFDHDAWAFGMTNLLLLVACGALIYLLCRSLALSAAAALLAAAAWLFNFHGINMAVLWISGRTSLLLTLFALAAAIAAVRGKPWWTALWCAAALFSKEEAIALPLILVLWTSLRAGWPALVALAPYFALRAQSNAFWPHNAPGYYRFTTDIGAVLTNIVHYVDRAGTAFVVAGVLLGLAARAGRFGGRSRHPNLTAEHANSQRFVDQSIAFKSVVWLLGGFALTVWVPVRSSLYAVFPSVGSALLLGAYADVVFGALGARARQRTAIALLVVPFLLLPVYHARNGRWVHLADLSTSVRNDLEAHTPALRAGGPVWILDDRNARTNIANAFGNALPDAVQMDAGFRPDLRVTSEPAEIPPDATMFTLRAGHLVPGR